MRLIAIAIAIPILLTAGCAVAPVAPAPPTPAPPHEAAKPGGIELSGAICAHGIFGFHFKTDGPAEGNAYFRLLQLATLCRQGQEGDDEAKPESDEHPLPKGVERL